MQIRVISDIDNLASSVTEQLSAQGHEVEQLDDEASTCSLRYSNSAPIEELTGLMNSLKPFLPRVSLVDDLEDVDAELELGDEADLDAVEVRTKTNSRKYTQKLHNVLLELGFNDNGTEHVDAPENTLKYGGASAFSRQVVRWFLALDGIEVKEEKVWGDDDDDIYINVRRGTGLVRDGDEASHTLPVVLEGDDFRALFTLKDALESSGFSRVEVRALDDQEAKEFRISPGAFSDEPSALSQIRETIESVLAEQEVDLERFPLKSITIDGEDSAMVRLPLSAHSKGEMFSYAGSFPDRWDMVLRSDSERAREILQEKFTEAGYTRLRTEELPDNTLGARVLWGAAEDHEEVHEFVRDTITETLTELGAPAEVRPYLSRNFGDDDARVMIDVPAFAIEGGDIHDRIVAACREWECKLYTPAPAALTELSDALRALSFKEYVLETDTDVEESLIKYGGAPPELVAYVSEIVFQHTGERPRMNKVWGDSDDDIWIYMPQRGYTPQSKQEPESPDLQEWFSREIEGETRPFMKAMADDDAVRIGHVLLKRRELKDADKALVPSADEFGHYCLDQRTAESLLHLSESISLREPCLLEGETSVSKTSVIQYLAMLINQPVVRINLNGQTDTGELVGRFVPRAEEDESESAHPWRWQDGLVIEAMKRGWWVVLDELNLAEPQILERLNSVLERQPSIILTEYDNSLIGTGGTPVHPDFRIFATMNPAEYAGRSPLSPAYRDRWRGYRYVEAPGEAEYRAMLTFLVEGQHPEVTLFGESYAGTKVAPAYPQLQDVPHIEQFLAAVARFHATLEGATVRAQGGARLGARRRERYVFTRRGLLSVIDYLALALHGGHSVLTMRAALARYYISRLSSSQDRTTVLRLLDAAGIGPNTWTIGEEGEATDE